MKKFNNEEAHQALANAKASMAVEDMHLAKNEEALIHLKLTGQISSAEFKRRALELSSFVTV